MERAYGDLVERARNEALAAWLAENEETPAEFAERVNERMLTITGKYGSVSERTVFRWLSGENRWPQERQRRAIESLAKRSAVDLGFVPRAANSASPEVDPVHRRAFLATTGATAVTSAIGSRPTVGASDVQRVRVGLAGLKSLDDQEGGSGQLEARAIALRDAAWQLQQSGHATQRVRSRLYALMAAASATAAWAAIDARAAHRAQQHINATISLAGLSCDGQVQHEAWRYTSMLAGQRKHHSDAVAAAEAMLATSAQRRDPLYASCGHSRLASVLSRSDSRQDAIRARRALERATAAYERVDPAEPRPTAMEFYTRGELHGLTALVLRRLGMPEEAESHLHRCLAALQPEQKRNRHLYTASLALAQLDQGEIELAYDTATSINEPASERVRHSLLKGFTVRLTRIAPGASLTHEWTEYARTL